MKKLKLKAMFKEEILNKSGLYSFLNMASLSSFFKSQNNSIEYFCDGFLMCMLVKLVTGKKVDRVSFDFTSIADDVFQYAVEKELKIAFVGAEHSELQKFIKKIQDKYQDLKIHYSHDGYFSSDKELDIANEIVASGINFLIVGLGAGKQEKFLAICKENGFMGVGFSCGGFIRQEASTTVNYYPDVVDKLNLRAFYRMYKEPHTIRRYLFDYPVNFFKFVYLKISRKLVITIQ